MRGRNPLSLKILWGVVACAGEGGTEHTLLVAEGRAALAAAVPVADKGARNANEGGMQRHCPIDELNSGFIRFQSI